MSFVGSEGVFRVRGAEGKLAGGLGVVGSLKRWGVNNGLVIIAVVGCLAPVVLVHNSILARRLWTSWSERTSVGTGWRRARLEGIIIATRKTGEGRSVADSNLEEAHKSGRGGLTVYQGSKA